MAANIKLEIVADNGRIADVAFYYDIASPIAAAADPSRTAAGTKLDPQSLLDLQAGTIHEYVRRVDFRGLTMPQAKAKAAQAYDDFADAALLDYQSRYSGKSFVGVTWDGTTWST